MVRPESVMMRVHSAGKKTSTPGTSPGSKVQPGTGPTKAAADAGALTATPMARFASRTLRTIGIRRITVPLRRVVDASRDPAAVPGSLVLAHAAPSCSDQGRATCLADVV